jgi:hypothetical protein
LEHEIFRESFGVPLDSLVKDLCWNPVQFCKIRVQHDAMAPDGENPLVDIFRPKAGNDCVGLWLYILDHGGTRINYRAQIEPIA